MAQSLQESTGTSSQSQAICDYVLLLIGKTGHGKSATGNSILRKQKFTSSGSTSSVTKLINFNFGIFHGNTFKVVDGPGVADNTMSEVQALESIQEKMKYALTVSVEGYHAFLLVLKYGIRFTTEEAQAVECLKQIFGMDFVKKHCIIVMTGGDDFKAEMAAKKKEFKQWLTDQQGPFKKLLDECEGRAVLFDNRTKDAKEASDQIERLLVMVASLGGNLYTDDNFKAAEHLRQEQIVSCNEPVIREETLMESNILTQEVEDLEELDPEVQIPKLEKLLIRADRLYESVMAQDKGTGVLKFSLGAAKNIRLLVKSQLDDCKCEKQRTDEERQKYYEERQSIINKINDLNQKAKEQNSFLRLIHEIAKALFIAIYSLTEKGREMTRHHYPELAYKEDLETLDKTMGKKFLKKK